MSEEFYEKMREQVKHEDKVVRDRMVWMGAFQGALFGSLVFAWQNKDSNWLVVVFSVLGAFIAANIFLSIVASTLALQNILKEWDRRKPKDYSGPDIISYAPGSPGSRRLWAMLLAPWCMIPLSFIAAWACVFWINYTTWGRG